MTTGQAHCSLPEVRITSYTLHCPVIQLYIMYNHIYILGERGRDTTNKGMVEIGKERRNYYYIGNYMGIREKKSFEFGEVRVVSISVISVFQIASIKFKVSHGSVTWRL